MSREDVDRLPFKFFKTLCTLPSKLINNKKNFKEISKEIKRTTYNKNQYQHLLQSIITFYKRAHDTGPYTKGNRITLAKCRGRDQLILHSLFSL